MPFVGPAFSALPHASEFQSSERVRRRVAHNADEVRVTAKGVWVAVVLLAEEEAVFSVRFVGPERIFTRRRYGSSDPPKDGFRKGPERSILLGPGARGFASWGDGTALTVRPLSTGERT